MGAKRMMWYGEENEALMDAGQQALSCENIDMDDAVKQVFGGTEDGTGGGTAISEGTFVDADLDKWIDGRFHTECGATLMKTLLMNPCTEKERVVARQAIITRPELHLSRLLQLLAEARKLERDALWVLVKPDIKKTWPLPFLFPTMMGVRHLNSVPLFHEFYHFSRLVASPALTVLYPLGMVLGPWIYFRFKLGWKLSFKAYVVFAMQMLRTLKGGVAIKVWGTLAVYAGLYLYSVAQVIDLARMVGGARQTLVARQAKVERLLTIADSLKSVCGGADVEFAGFYSGSCDGLSVKPGKMGFLGVWEWWGNPDTAASIKNALRIIAAADVVAAGALCLGGSGGGGRVWSAVEFGGEVGGEVGGDVGGEVVGDVGGEEIGHGGEWPRFYGMRHPALGGRCVANPAALDKNVIITGPNAAGKTTYCRGLLANILLAQTLGIACARRATMGGRLFGGIVSFMRISDETGMASLFEAEVARCVEMWKVAEEQTKMGRPVFMVLDEPMHATPPTEGAAAAMAFMKGLARMETVRIVATTHYAAITSLAFEESRDFVNVSMEAVLRRGKKIAFPYKLRQGPSFQSIALELMQEQGAFPGAFVEDALKIKEKIGGREIV